MYLDAYGLQALIEAQRRPEGRPAPRDQAEQGNGVGTVQASTSQAKQQANGPTRRPGRPKGTPSYERPGPAPSRWQEQANCGPAHRAAWGVTSIEDLDALFTVSVHAQKVPDAVRVICGLCPVRTDCLRDAVLEQQASAYPHALVRGGMTPSQITRLIRHRKQAMAQ